MARGRRNESSGCYTSTPIRYNSTNKLTIYKAKFDTITILMQTFGSQTWDTALGLQALMACNIADEVESVLGKGHDYLKKAQVS